MTGARELHPALLAPPGELHWSRDGIPLLVAETDRYFALHAEDWDAELDAMSFGALAYLARYVPSLLAPNAPLRRIVRAALARHVTGEVDLAVELGCAVGADLRTLADAATHVIGIDGSIAGLRAARTQLAGEPLTVLRRVEGRSFETDDAIELEPVDNVSLALGDALAAPVADAAAGIVLAVNLLDSVAHPLGLVAELDRILAPGGLLILTSPLSWNESITPAEHALGGGTAQGWAELGTVRGLGELLSGRLPLVPGLGRYALLEEHDVPWTVREHARMVATYDVHVWVARKLATP